MTRGSGGGGAKRVRAKRRAGLGGIAMHWGWVYTMSIRFAFFVHVT